MPLDAITVSALTKELKCELQGGKIEKVQQPQKDMLLISFRAKGRNRKLVLSSATGGARLHITENSLENPAEAPMFCMLMRKHLVGSKILSVSQPEHERMIVLELDTFDELGVSSTKKLVCEMMGRSSNIILIAQDGRIIDCIRRSDSASQGGRAMLPGMIYRLPPKQDKLDFFEASYDEIEQKLCSADFSRPWDKIILDSFSGLSPLLCREISYRAGGEKEKLALYLKALKDTVEAEIFTPCMVLQDNVPRDFSFMPIKQYGQNSSTESFSSFSKLLDAYYSRQDKALQQQRRSHELKHSVKIARDRMQRKLLSQSEELRRTENMEDVRREAELVTANIYRMKKGDRALKCQDYYDPQCREILIELDPLKTPQQNSAALFKQYNKLKGAKEHLSVLIGQSQKQLDYLNSVLEELERAESEKDIAEIRQELILTGYIKKKKNGKPERVKKQAPLRFVSDDGFEILVGRSNSQNDDLTTKMARRTDYWLHVQKVHGSHVIISCEGSEPSKTAIEQAASLAVYYSQGRDGGKTPVDYTMVRLVRKPSGAMPGKVIYTDYKTIIAEADEKLMERLKK